MSLRNIIVFGATGQAGLEVVRSALERGYNVTAFLRDAKKMAFSHPNLKVVEGDATVKSDVARHMKGMDAIVSALNAIEGSRRLLFIGNILDAMREQHIKRVISIGGVGALHASEHVKVYEAPDFPSAYVELSKAHERVYEALVASRTDFTFICPLYIVDGERTGIYDVRDKYPTKGSTIRSSDLADFIINELEENRHVREKVGISND